MEDSDELYIVSSGAKGSIKVRGGQLDVKRLEEVDDEGLQQWRPVAKAEFPIDATEMSTCSWSLDVTVPSLDSRRVRPRQLVAEIVATHDELLSVPVHKHGSTTSSTAAWRSSRMCGRARGRRAPSPSRTRIRLLVRSAVEALGLWPRPNVSFPRGLKPLVGFGARRHAVDRRRHELGEVRPRRTVGGRTVAHVVDRAEVTRLGEGLADVGRLDPSAIGGRPTRSRRWSTRHVVRGGRRRAAGTAWLRAADNADELVDAVRARSGVEIEMIDGEEEARLSYLAATPASAPSTARSSSSRRAAGARSSRSVTATGSTTGSVSTSGRCGSPSVRPRGRRRRAAARRRPRRHRRRPGVARRPSDARRARRRWAAP